MKLSTRGRYGARLMLDLALHYGKGNTFLKDIASRQEISQKYLWQLIAPLRNAGLINSTRGAHGGYTLAKPPAQINMRDIISVVEGDICIVERVDEPSSCQRADTCVTMDIWQELKENILQILESYTLEDMVEKQKEKFKVGTYEI